MLFIKYFHGLRWAGHVARVGESGRREIFLLVKPEGTTPLGDLGVDGKDILKWVEGRFAWSVLFWFLKRGSVPWKFPNLLC